VRPGDAAAGFTYVINWGDGSPVQTISPTPDNTAITEAHQYISTGTFTVSVTASDQFNIASTAATQPIQIGIAEVEADSNGQGGITGLAISGISGSQGVVLAGTTGNSVKITRGGKVLGSYVATNGNIAIYGDGGTDLVTISGTTTSANAFTLTGDTATYTAAAFSPNTFTIALDSISQVTLQGGNHGDSFTNTAATVPSVLIGGTSADTYTFAGSSMGAAATIQDKGGNNTLYAPTLAANQANTWTINGTNSGDLNGASWSFSGIQNLVGGANDDLFQFVGAGRVTGNVNGNGAFSSAGSTLDYRGYSGASTVTLNLANDKATAIGSSFSNIETALGQASTASDTLIGPNTTTAWAISGANSGTANAFNFSGFGNLTGGSGADTFTVGSNGSLTGILDGGSGKNTIVGPNLADTFNITANNAGNLNTAPIPSFTRIQNLTGGGQPTSFVFGAGVSVSGNINGGTGGGTLNYQNYSTNVSVNLQTSRATGVGGAVTNLVGIIGGGGNNTLRGANAANTWNITAANAGNINGSLTFAGFADLTGGTASDFFVFSNGSAVSGTINGGTGTSRLDYSAYLTGVYVNLVTGAATGAGNVTNIQQVYGSGNNDVLVGNGAGVLLMETAGMNLMIGRYRGAGHAR